MPPAAQVLPSSRSRLSQRTVPGPAGDLVRLAPARGRPPSFFNYTGNDDHLRACGCLAQLDVDGRRRSRGPGALHGLARRDPASGDVRIRARDGPRLSGRTRSSRASGVDRPPTSDDNPDRPRAADPSALSRADCIQLNPRLIGLIPPYPRPYQVVYDAVG